MTTKQINKSVHEKLEGATFEQLVEIFTGLENAGVYNSDIDNAIMEKMEEVNEDKFLKWAEDYE